MLFLRALLALGLCFSISGAATRPKPVRTTPDRLNPTVRKWMRSMSLRDKVAQLIVMPIYGEAPNTRSAVFRRYVHFVRDLHVGGVIVTGYGLHGNFRYADPYALGATLNRLQRMSRLPLLVGADFERGASMRVASTTAWPYDMAFAAAKDLSAATYEGAEAARDARAIGVNWIFAPVSDVNNNPDNPIINIRAYSENPAEVASFVQAYIAGAHSDSKNPVLVTAKHFPGHGDTAIDSHLGLARLDADKDRIESVELEPFRSAIAAGVDSIMTAHLAVPALDPQGDPATVSAKIITGVLRDELNFHGIVVTDAMDMQGLASLYDTAEASVRAIEAGNDVLLMPKNAEQAINGILAAIRSKRISRRRLDESVAKVLSAKVHLGLNRKKIVNLEQIAEIVGSPEAEERAQDLADRSVTLVKETGDAVPLRNLESTCVFALTESRRSQQGLRLIEELKKRGSAITTLIMDPNMTKADFDMASEQASHCNQIVVAAYVTVSAYRGNVAMAGSYPDFVAGLIAKKFPVTLIALGNPYLVRSFPDVATYLTTYSPTPTSEVAVAKALLGEIAISGRLPVTIPGVAKYGDGVQLSASSPTTSKGF